LINKAAIIAIKTTYFNNLSVLEKAFTKKLFAELDPEIVSLSIRAMGYYADSLDYTLVWQHLEACRELNTKAPGLLPLWLNIRRCEVLRRSLSGWTYIYTSTLGKAPIRPDSMVNPMQAVKDALAGITPAGWRYLVKLKPKWTHALIWKYDLKRPLKNIVRILNILGQVKVIPKLAAFKKFIDFLDSSYLGRDWEHEAEVINQEFIAVVREAFKREGFI
jgi:hypothetical protein